jgi:tetratricopeptide (TPR) repeat protein
MFAQMKAIAPDEAFPRARAAAVRALELDAQQPEAHVSLGLVRAFWEWDWAGSESAFRRAIAIAPGYAMAHCWYGYLLSALGRHEEALSELRLALDLDPLSLVTLAAIGSASFYARRYEEAIAHYRHALDIEPDFPAVLADLARTLEYSGRTAEAVQEFERALGSAGTPMTSHSAGLANALALSGRVGEAREMPRRSRGGARRATSRSGRSPRSTRASARRKRHLGLARASLR